MTNKYEKTDYRKYYLQYTEGAFSKIIRLELTQLELLKIYLGLTKTNNKQLMLKIKKLIKTVDKDQNETTNFERKLPRSSNGRILREWQDIIGN